MPSISANVHLDVNSQITSESGESGRAMWITLVPKRHHYGDVGLFLDERAAERLVVVATEHYRKMIKNDLDAERELAVRLAGMINGSRATRDEMSATTAEDGAPSILVDTADGRSFVVDVREV